MVIENEGFTASNSSDSQDNQDSTFFFVDVVLKGLYQQIKERQGLTFQDIRKAFCDWLIVCADYNIYWAEVYSKFYGKNIKHPRYSCFMKFGVLKDGELSDLEEYNGLNFNKDWNTRVISPYELQIDFDSPDWNVNIQAFYDTWKNLEKAGKKFFIFCAEGMKSPRIIIYDLLPIEIEKSGKKTPLDEASQYMARLKFCNKYVSNQYWGILDKAMLETGHPCQLEFAKHYKTGKMFRLMMEVGYGSN